MQFGNNRHRAVARSVRALTRIAVIAGMVAGGVVLPAQASDRMLKALAERGFVPWAEDYAGELAYPQRPASGDLLLGDGFLLRLPDTARADRFLVSTGTQSVIVDRIPETGPMGLSLPAIRALGLEQDAGRAPVKLKVIALAKLDTTKPKAKSALRNPASEIAIKLPLAGQGAAGTGDVPGVSKVSRVPVARPRP